MTASPLTHVDLPTFDGPLALLIELIERDKLEVTTISVGAITSEYLERVSTIKNLETSQLTEFIQLGSRLVYIKSLALLPEQASQSEELALLEKDLTEYKRFREAAELLQSRLRSTRSWTKGSPYEAPVGRIPTDVSLQQLSNAFSLALKRNQPLGATSILKRHLDINSVIKNLLNHVKKQPIELQLLIDKCQDRLEIIVTFLALLEVVKSGQVIISQAEQFGNISISDGSAL